ncbi:MAG: hypothetical protein HXY28_14935 [Hydrogenophilaceae bacterium]|jgi:hypothetical protein|nr:hypothetical protein [Hydrogenophilaceae bacterium]
MDALFIVVALIVCFWTIYSFGFWGLVLSMSALIAFGFWNHQRKHSS